MCLEMRPLYIDDLVNLFMYMYIPRCMLYTVKDVQEAEDIQVLSPAKVWILSRLKLK